MTASANTCRTLRRRLHLQATIICKPEPRISQLQLTEASRPIISVILEGHPPLRGENPGSGIRFAQRLCAGLCEGDKRDSA